MTIVLLRFACLVLVVVGGLLGAAEHATTDDEPVAVIDGEAITLRRLEDELLKREGADLVERLLHETLPRTEWKRLGDADPVLITPSGRLLRQQLVAELMAKHGEAVMGEMLDSELVRAALVRSGIAIDDAMIRAEIAHLERRLGASLAARGLPNMDIDSFFRQQKGVGIDEYVLQPGFRWLVAGLHALAREEAATQLGEAELRARYDRDPAAWTLAEACDCQAIFIPYQTTPGADGKPLVSDDERLRLDGVIDTIHRQLVAGKTDFGVAYRLFARSYDVDADGEGRIGWIRRDGSRDKRGARVLAPEVIKAVFAVKGPFPLLLPPIAHPAGVEIVRVLGWRPASQSDFTVVRDRLVEQAIESTLEARKRAVLERLRTAASPTRDADGGIVAGGFALTRRAIEDEILAREGGKAAIAAGAKLIATIDWSRVAMDDDVVATADWRLPRRGFAARLLGERGAKAREDLITLVLIRRQLEREGAVVGPGDIEGEIQRLERAYRRSPEAARRDFRAFVLESHGAPLEILRQDPAFRLLAGTALLVRRHAQLGNDELAAYHAAHRERYREPAAADLAIIYLPYRAATPGAALTEADRSRAGNAAGELHAALARPGADFADAWREFGKRNDPYAREGGVVGWIPRDGSRDNPAARRIPDQVMAAAFASSGPYPALLPPITHAQGAEVVLVRARREARDPTLAELADRLRRDCLEDSWDDRLTAYIDTLRRAAVIDYRELGPMIAARRGPVPVTPEPAPQAPAAAGVPTP